MSLISQHWGRSTTDPRYPEMRGAWGEEIYAFAGGPVEEAAWRERAISCATCTSSVMPNTGATSSSIAGDRYTAVAVTPAAKI